MSEIPKVLKDMMEMWNETDLSRIEGYVEAIFADDVVFIDPSNSIVGKPAFVEMVKKFRTSFPDAVCSRASGVDAHHGLHRYHWAIHRGEELLVDGFDVTEVNDQDRVCRVEGFFGPIPQGET